MKRWFVWNCVFRLQELAKGHPTFSILRQMEAADRMSPGQLQQLQSDNLREFIGYAHRHVPYVRAAMAESGADPGSIRGPEDLQCLPVMTKADVRANRERLRSEIATRLQPFTTGGSTGEPLIFDLGKRRVAARVACRQRVSRWWGLSAGDPEIALWGSPVELSRQDRIRGLRDRLMRTRLLSAFEMNETTMTDYVRQIAAGNWAQIFGYPSAIYLLCLHARQQGVSLRKSGIRVAFVTGEVLLPHQRATIADTLGCAVADGYGGRDSGFIAHECPQGRMHLLTDAVIVEVLDEQRRPVPPGQPGEIVVTDLYSHEAPFLRYATGDMAVLSTDVCPCGRPMPVLERIEGRANDVILAADGRLINSLALIYPVREVQGIGEFRICQKRVDAFRMQIVRGPGYHASGEEHIRKGWEQLLRAKLDIVFEYVDSIPREGSGKFRHVVSELEAGKSLRTTGAS